MSTNPLGKETRIPKELSPDLLFGISRSEARAHSKIKEPLLLFVGQDIWNCYELSWLDTAGKPISATCQICYDCHTERIIESKSLKLYLSSFNQSNFLCADQVADRIFKDLYSVVGSPSVSVDISCSAQRRNLPVIQQSGECIDQLSPGLITSTSDKGILKLDGSNNVVSERLYSDLFRSLCPVTSQPDWGRVTIEYQGPQIKKESFLAYLISYREHQGFHEDCCERIFNDIMDCCSPSSLSVMCSFLRRGGIDINPIRSTPNIEPLIYQRTFRQ